MPARSSVRRLRRTRMRAVWNAIPYLAATGCQWAQLPKHFLPYATVQHYFYKLRDSGVLDLIYKALACASRLLAGRPAEPMARVIDSQSVKATESGSPGGYDAGNQSEGPQAPDYRRLGRNPSGRARHTADVQDRHGAAGVISNAKDSFSALLAPLYLLRLCRQQAGDGDAENRWSRHRDRPACRWRKRPCRHRETLGRRTRLRLDRTMQEVGKRLGNQHCLFRSLDSHGIQTPPLPTHSKGKSKRCGILSLNLSIQATGIRGDLRYQKVRTKSDKIKCGDLYNAP